MTTPIKSAQVLNLNYLARAERDPAALRRDFDDMVLYMKGSTAIHHGEYVRTCYLPKLFTESQFAALKADMRVLYGIFAKVIDAWYADPAYRALFRFSPQAEDLILHADRSVSMLPMARIDFFYNELTGAYTFCEFNTDGSSAMNEDRELHNAQRLSEGYRNFTANHRTRRCELFDSWVNTVVRLWRRRGETGPLPAVAIVDYLECGTVNEFEIFRSRFEVAGLPAEVCDVRDLRFDGRTLTGPAGRPIQVIYRRAVTSDLLAHLEESRAMIEAARAGAVLLLGDFQTQIVHNKELFRVLHRPETAALLTRQERRYIADHLPYTVEYTPDLAPRVIANKDSWILKPADSYGSRGVHAGVESTPEEWRAIVESTPAEGMLLQAFHLPFVSENYGFDAAGRFGRHRYYNLTGLYVYDGEPQGLYSRVSLTPIISSQYSEKTLPTLIVQD